MVASEQCDDLRRSNCDKLAMDKVKPLDLWKYESFGAKLKAKRMVWEATIPVEGVKRGAKGKVYVPNIYARYKRDLSDNFSTKIWLRRKRSKFDI